MAAIAPAIWPPIKIGTLFGEMPEKVSVAARASVTAGLANDVEDEPVSAGDEARHSYWD